MPYLSLLQHLSHKHKLRGYLTALEEGDLETTATLLEQAAQDRVLAQMIFDSHANGQADAVPFLRSDMYPVARTRSRSVVRVVERVLAAVLVLALITGWFALGYLHSSSGTPGHFSDTSVPSLGAPIVTLHGNFNGINQWSADGHTFITVQVNEQKHELEAHYLTIATGHTTVYPVLDASWISVIGSTNIVYLAMDRYLLALRAQGEKHATLEIWDVLEQHVVMTQTIPARIGGDNQILSPWIFYSNSEQKFALYSPDGTLSIWDAVRGKKLITCEGKVPLIQDLPHLHWYNHDQDLLFSHVDPPADGQSQVQAWNTVTGTRLFDLNGSSKRTYDVPLLSPDGKYLALSAGPHVASNGNFQPDTLEIRDALTAKVLRSFRVTFTGGIGEIGMSNSWVSDSRRLSSIELSDTGPDAQKMLVRVWNVFTGQTTLTFSASYIGAIWSGFVSPDDGQYLIVGAPDGTSMDIWHLSDGHEVTVATPGIYARSDSFVNANDHQMIIGQRGNFDIWDMASGKLLYKYHGYTPFSLPGVSGSQVFWSPDGKYLTLVAGKSISMENGLLSIWRLP